MKIRKVLRMKERGHVKTRMMIVANKVKEKRKDICDIGPNCQ